jgi:glycosyltransferase involved in cell wall biosynthesis
MFFYKQHTALYAVFDVFPSYKGSSTHIRYFAKALYDFMGDLAIFCLADRALSAYENDNENSLEIYRFKFLFDNYLERVKAYGNILQYAVASQNQLKIAHYRDPWSGFPILQVKNKSCKTIYEVNAFPSIELVHLYTNIHPYTLKKIYDIEQFCLEHSDAIIVVSELLKNYVLKRGIPSEKIYLIPNGFDKNLVQNATPYCSEYPYILYFGALQPWQGLDILIRALPYIQEPNLRLKIVASQKKKSLKFYEKLIEKLHLQEKVDWYFELEQKELFAMIQSAQAVIAPLTDCARNSEQGCCPFKMIESMGNGALVIASDLPSTRELIKHKETGLLCRSNRPIELARTIQWALENPQNVSQIRNNALLFATENYSWDVQLSKLNQLYQKMIKKF